MRGSCSSFCVEWMRFKSILICLLTCFEDLHPYACDAASHGCDPDPVAFNTAFQSL